MSKICGVFDAEVNAVVDLYQAIAHEDPTAERAAKRRMTAASDLRQQLAQELIDLGRPYINEAQLQAALAKKQADMAEQMRRP
jgi:hypothetical protein